MIDALPRGYYVYLWLLWERRRRIDRYVGKGINGRCLQHMRYASDYARKLKTDRKYARYVEGLRERPDNWAYFSMQPKVYFHEHRPHLRCYIIAEGLSQEAAHHRERYEIAVRGLHQWRTGPLLNNNGYSDYFAQYWGCACGAIGVLSYGRFRCRSCKRPVRKFAYAGHPDPA